MALLKGSLMSRIPNHFPQMTVVSSPLIARKLSSQPSQEDRFRALDRTLARRYVSHILRQHNIALDRRVRQGSLVYKPRYASSPNYHLPAR